MARKKATRKKGSDKGESAGRSARPFWSGTLTFGLVSVPVDLYPGNRTNRAPLRMLSPEGEPLARRYYSEKSGDDLKDDEMVRGFELEKDRYVIVTDEELERLAPEQRRAGLATFVMRGKEYLVAIFPENGILRAETMRFVDEIRSPKEIGLPEKKKVSAATVKKFERLVAKHSVRHLPFKDLKDQQTEKLLKLV